MTPTPEPAWADKPPPPWIFEALAAYEARDLTKTSTILSAHPTPEVIEWLIVVSLAWAAQLWGSDQLRTALPALVEVAEIEALAEDSNGDPA